MNKEYKVYHKPVEQIEIKGIEPPPDYIFKFRKNRAAPAQDVWGNGGSISYIPHHAEYIEGEGNFVYWWGTPFPSRTVAPVEAIYAIGSVKRSILMDIYLFSTLLKTMPWRTKIGIALSILAAGKKRRGRVLNDYFKLFNDKHEIGLVNFYLEDGYYSNITKEIRKFVQTFLISLGVDKEIAIKTGEIIGMLFEYDNAYRHRLHDLMNEIRINALIGDFPAELTRLLDIQSSREALAGGGEHVTFRFQSAAKILKYSWYIPSIRKALKKACEALNLENVIIEEMDVYHTCLFGDYNFQGRTLEERLKILEKYHGSDQTKWAPRIQIKSR